MGEKQNFDLTSDWVFKRIFSKEGNEDILLDLLSAILDINIKRLEVKNNELTKNMEKRKKSILDIKAELDDKTIIDIEMQVNDKNNMIDRDLQHLTKLYSEQLESGEDYIIAKKVIIINILEYNLCNRNTYHSKVHLKYEDYDKDTYYSYVDKEDEVFTDKLEIHIVEIPKFIKSKNIEDSKLVEWLQLISGKEELMQMALSKKAKAIEKAYKELQYLKQDEKAREEFDAYQRLKMDERDMRLYAEAKGIKKGIKEGEKNKSIEIAKKMLEENADIDFIIKVTSLTKEEIEQINKG